MKEESAINTNKSYYKGCGAEIIWVKTKTGKLTPNNLDGITHWATCPNAKHFKKQLTENPPII